MQILPGFVAKLFWDTELPDVIRHKKFIIERIMELGDIQEVNWMKSTYTNTDLAKVLKTSKCLSGKSANLWLLRLKVDKNQIPCLNKSFPSQHNRFF